MTDDPVDSRREAMIDILASWDLEDAVPQGAGLEIVREYVSGDLTIAEAVGEVPRRLARKPAKDS